VADFVQNAPKVVVAEEVQDVVVAAYYPEIIRSPVVARETAQRAFAVVTTISAALVAAGALVNLPERSGPVVALGLAALGLWFVGSLLFMQAMGSRAFVKSPDPHDKAQWAVLALRESIASRNRLYGWLVAARIVTLIAVVATLSAFVAAVLEIRNDRTERAVVRLTFDEGANIISLCPHAGDGILGRVDVATLQEPLVVFEPDSGQCINAVDKLRLPSRGITSVEKRTR
jgi:hypothetical protein